MDCFGNRFKFYFSAETILMSKLEVESKQWSVACFPFPSLLLSLPGFPRLLAMIMAHEGKTNVSYNSSALSHQATDMCPHDNA